MLEKNLINFFTVQQVVQKEREDKLAEILKDRLHQYIIGNKEAFVSNAKAEVEKLSKAGTLYLLDH